MLTCKINKPQTYLITRETTSTVHLKASKVSFYAPVCQLNTESHLTEFQGQVLPGNKMVGGVLQEQKNPQFCGIKSFPPGTKGRLCHEIMVIQDAKERRDYGNF